MNDRLPAPVPAAAGRRQAARRRPRGLDRRHWPRIAALVLAAGLTALNVRTMAHLYGVDPELALALALPQNAPLPLAVTRPLPAWCAMTAADLAAAPVLLHAPGLTGNSWPWPPAVLVGQLAVLAALTRRERPVALVAVWAALTGSGYALAAAAPQDSDGTDTFLAVFGGVVLLVGWMARERAATQRRMVQQQLAGQAERARLTLLEERARIARELHDVVAHHMSLITVQADSAPYRIGGLPEEAGPEFGAIAATAREALVEMRRLLGVLRGADGDDPELAPQPGLARLPELADAAARGRRLGRAPGVEGDRQRAAQHQRAHPLRVARGVHLGQVRAVRLAPQVEPVDAEGRAHGVEVGGDRVRPVVRAGGADRPLPRRSTSGRSRRSSSGPNMATRLLACSTTVSPGPPGL